MVVALDRSLVSVFRQMAGGAYPPTVESFERGKTIFFPGDPAERVYLLSLITGTKSDRFYHAVAFTPVEILSVPVEQMEKAFRENPELAVLILQSLATRILQTEMMIETLAHRDMGSRLVSFLLILCRDFGVPASEGVTIDLKLSHQAIAEAIGSTRVTITRLLGDLRDSNAISIHKKKITVHNPVSLGHQFA
jgi:CRP/FNR family transcriptional regulator, global nitrogen regulator